jgi:hypothetical protein
MARRILVALALAALAAALTACGVSRTVDPVAGAATKSQTSGYKSTMTMILSAGGTQLTLTAEGEFDGQEGELNMDLSDLLGKSGAPAGVDGSVKTIYLTEDGDPVVYLKLGLLSSFLPGGKTWIRMDVAKAGKAAGIDLGKLMGGAQNPGDALKLLQSSGDFAQVGTETVGGAETTHYRGTIDLHKALAATGAPQDLIQRLLDQGAPTQYPVDAWIDDSGYIRQLEMSYGETLNGQTMSMSLKTDMTDYGTDVNVSAPPADEVFDVTDVAGQGLASALSGTTH